MDKPVKVFKFGGSSLKDADGVKNVANILKDYQDEQLIIVVSAMGKTTNALELVVEAHAQGHTEDAISKLEAVKDRHYSIAKALFPPDHEVFDLINDSFVEVEWVLEEEPHHNYDYSYDQIVSVGELASSRLVASYLNYENLLTHWLDARDIIITDDIFREGWVNWPETTKRADQMILPQLKKPGFILTQGFIGSTSENFTTTLGREGSDYTGAILSYCVNAESMTIWKDVPGVLTADPRYFDNVIKIDRLSYKEAIEMTYYGAKVIHPKTIKPLQNKSIPLLVKSFIEPTGSGTLIEDDVEDSYPPMVAIERNQVMLNISTRDFSFVAEHHMSTIFKRVAELRLQVNMMQNTAISFVLCVTDFGDRVEDFVTSMQKEFFVRVDKDLEIITIRHFQQGILETLKEGKVILLEERLRNTIQMVVKEVPMMKPKNL